MLFANSRASKWLAGCYFQLKIETTNAKQIDWIWYDNYNKQDAFTLIRASFLCFCPCVGIITTSFPHFSRPACRPFDWVLPRIDNDAFGPTTTILPVTAEKQYALLWFCIYICIFVYIFILSSFSYITIYINAQWDFFFSRVCDVVCRNGKQQQQQRETVSF